MVIKKIFAITQKPIDSTRLAFEIETDTGSISMLIDRWEWEKQLSATDGNVEKARNQLFALYVNRMGVELRLESGSS